MTVTNTASCTPPPCDPKPPSTSSQTVLARDGAARSATTETRDQLAPAIRLSRRRGPLRRRPPRRRRNHRRSRHRHRPGQRCRRVVEGLTSCAAWPALRATLLLNAVDGRDPLVELRTAAAEHELESARDPAAVLTWRIRAPQGVGPLPWLPPIPANLTGHPGWGPYLSARAELVQACAEAVREEAGRSGHARMVAARPATGPPR